MFCLQLSKCFYRSHSIKTLVQLVPPLFMFKELTLVCFKDHLCKKIAHSILFLYRQQTDTDRFYITISDSEVRQQSVKQMYSYHYGYIFSLLLLKSALKLTFWHCKTMEILIIINFSFMFYLFIFFSSTTYFCFVIKAKD